jgi:hypothetical protein
MALPITNLNWETSLAAKISDTATSLVVNRTTDSEGVTLSGTYGITVDEGTSIEEHMIVTFAGSAGTIVTRGLSRVDATTLVTANRYTHDRSASVKMTNLVLPKIIRRLNGTEAFDSVDLTGIASISGLDTPTSGELTKAANVEYVNDGLNAGAADASEVTKGISQKGTQAQVDARTATGSTGAPTFVSPEYLRATLYSDYAVDSVGTDSYAIAPTPAVTAYTAGQVFTWKAGTANTGASSLNVSGLGAVAIKKNVSEDTETGDILANQTIVTVYDGTNFQLVSSPAFLARANEIQNSSFVYAASSAGSDTYAITLSPSPASYAVGQVFYFLADVANTGAATLNVNALGAITIKKNRDRDLETGDIEANQVVGVIYDGTNFQMFTQLASYTLYASGVATRAIDAASGNQVIAHGLGLAPREVRICAEYKDSGNLSISFSNGFWNSSGQRATWIMVHGTMTNSAGDTESAQAVNILAGTGSRRQVGVITVDATNITIAWTLSGSTATGDIRFTWEANT